MRKIKVTMNYDNNKEVIIEVEEKATKSEINVICRKKFGNYDVKEWCDITPVKEEKTETEKVVEVEETEDLF